MTDVALTALLRWAMPRLGLDPRGYRNVRRTVLRRVTRRIAALGLAGPAAYRAYLEAHAGEWGELEAMCRIPISRLYRDAAVYELLEREILPERAAVARAERRDAVRVWSAGCASGEEPASIALAWASRAAREEPGVRLEIVATDADPEMLARAKAASYTEGSARELPPRLRGRAFEPGTFLLREELRAPTTFLLQDLRREAPPGPFDVVLCRNVAFTYFDATGQREAAGRLVGSLAPGGALVLGRGERLPAGVEGVVERAPLVYVRVSTSGAATSGVSRDAPPTVT